MSRLCVLISPFLVSSLCASLTPLSLPQIFRAMHNAYISYLSNPFTSPANDNPAVLAPPIRSVKFEKAMAAIAGRTSPALGEP